MCLFGDSAVSHSSPRPGTPERKNKTKGEMYGRNSEDKIGRAAKIPATAWPGLAELTLPRPRRISALCHAPSNGQETHAGTNGWSSRNRLAQKRVEFNDAPQHGWWLFSD